MQIFEFDDEIEDAAIYVISVAAKLAGMHPQTLRQYDRLGLVQPKRTAGRGRRYSRRDIWHLRQIQRLSQEEGVNLAGIARIMELQRSYDKAQQENRKLRQTLAALVDRDGRIFAAGPDGEVSQVSRAARARRPQVRRALLAAPSPLALTFYRTR